MNEIKVPKRKLCKMCGNYKVIQYFYEKKGDSSKIEENCRKCVNASKRETKNRVVNERYSLGLVGLTDNDFIDAFKFLKSIGYDLTKDIHQQFCEKYNLPTKEYTGVARRYLPSDLGMT